KRSFRQDGESFRAQAGESLYQTSHAQSTWPDSARRRADAAHRANTPARRKSVPAGPRPGAAATARTQLKRGRPNIEVCPLFQRKQILRTQSWKPSAPLTIFISTRMK